MTDPAGPAIPHSAQQLPGASVLVTRPENQAGNLCLLIEAAGGRAIPAPLLEIVPTTGEALNPDTLSPLDRWDWLVFVSVNAVQFGIPLLQAANPAPPAWPKIAAIGQATAQAIEQLGLAVDLTPKQQFNSEAFLALPEMTTVVGQRLLIVCGEGGRDLLAKTLTERGAQVAAAEVYRRMARPAFLLADAVSESWNVATATSGEALQHLTSLVTAQKPNALADIPLVVIGERLKQLAEDQGWRRVTAAGASDPALFAAIVDAFGYTESELNIVHYGDTKLVEEEKTLISATDPESEVAHAANTGHDTSVPKKKKSRFGSWLGYLTLLFVLLLIAAGVFLLHELRSKQEGLGSDLDKGDRQMQELLHQISALQTDLAAIHTQLATVQNQVTTEDSKFERELGETSSTLSEKLDTTKSGLEQSVQHIQQQLNKTRGDIMVADAEYLLSVANQKLHLVGDLKAVISAMEAADQRLHDSGDPAVFKVREALAGEINLLKGLNPPDIVGTSAKLLVMETKVKEMPLFLPHSERTKENRTEVPSNAPKTGDKNDQNVLDSTLKDLKDLVKIRRSDRPVQAILEPQEAQTLREIMLLRLEMARVALLRGDDALFKSNLDSANEWLQEHFEHESQATLEIKNQLEEIRAVPINIPFPDVSKSLSLLRNIEKLRLESEKPAVVEKNAKKAPELLKLPETVNTPEASKAPEVSEKPAAEKQP